MAKKKQRDSAEINAASMADIAFLLLIFFLVATTFPADKGLTMILPPKQDTPPEMEINDRNLYKILVNANDELLIEDRPGKITDVKEGVKRFVGNFGADPKSSDSPKDAVVSIKADRGTRYVTYVQVLDQVKAAYHELRAKDLGWTVDQYLEFKDKRAPEAVRQRFKQTLDKFPMQISEADPSKVGDNK